jgi:hypothetical protein
MQSRNRTYTKKSKNGKIFEVLVTWTQDRCVRCKRFLSKHGQKFCDRCRLLKDKKQDLECSNRLYQISSDFREERKLRAKVLRNADRFNVGDIL